MPKKKIKEQKKLPVYEIVINENDETTGVKMVSLVDDPAIEIQGMAFKKPRDWGKWKGIISPPCHFADAEQTIPNCKCDIIYNPLISDYEWITGPNPCKFCLEQKSRWDALNSKFSNQKFSANQDKKIIVGPALIPNKKIYRRDDETGDEYYVVFTPEVINQIVQKFNRSNNNRSINIDHSNRLAPGYIQENWLVADPVYDKSKVYGYDLPVDSWFIVVKIEDDEFWNTEIKELGKYSFSIEGMLGTKLMEFSLKRYTKDEELLEELTDPELIELAEYALQLLKG